LRDISFRQKFSVQVLALVPPDSRTFDYNPEPEQALLPGMTLIVLGEADHVKHLRRVLQAAD